MAVTENYKVIIQKFIRPGRAWNGEKFKRLIGAIGIEFGRVDEALETIEDERNVSEASIMLPDFENEYFKTPDRSGSEEERRARVLAKERAKGEASEAYLTNIINAFGYEIVEWRRHRPTRSNVMAAGERLATPSWNYAVRITLSPTPVGDANYDNMVVAIKKAAHANMILIFQ